MAQTYRDPTFDEVAAREASAQRAEALAAERAARAAERRADPAYTAMRRRKIARILKRVKLGLLK
ncbi:hypothetical protein HA052_24675 [Chromobacterium haemolyticum]|uniref:Uncharacterized protein n=1 Tax=Chromobacterium fluminis TaxID=3044269 RepID=A0ABX0LFI0_9NEIS|nr:hypothetical protein [Chromobacterium haemolyticum]NHR08391.1 hypothetical protein [Chromobacterium haemolyticum]